MLEVGLQCAGSMLLGVQIKSTPYIVSGGPLNYSLTQDTYVNEINHTHPKGVIRAPNSTQPTRLRSTGSWVEFGALITT